MELSLKGKVALVTGGSHGLGKAICLGLAAEGARVAINYRSDPQKAKLLADEITESFGVGAVTVFGDVSIEEHVHRMFKDVIEHFGRIDVLVNNSGICPISMIKDMSLLEWESVIRTNLTGTFLTCREMVNVLVDLKQTGSIVNIASQAAYNGSKTGKSHYAASKGGVVSFTYSLAKEVAGFGIRVNAVAPGMIHTEMTADTLLRNIDRYKSEIPLGRVAEAHEVARAVAFLVSDASSYITGTTVDVSGGMIGI